MLEVTPWLPVLVQWVGAKSDYYDCKCYQLAITASHCIQCFKKSIPDILSCNLSTRCSILTVLISVYAMVLGHLSSRCSTKMAKHGVIQ